MRQEVGSQSGDECLTVVHIWIPFFIEGCRAYDLHEMSVKRCLTEGVLKYEFWHDVHMSDFNQVNRIHDFKTFFMFTVYLKVLRNNAAVINNWFPNGGQQSLDVVEVLLNIFRAAWAWEDDSATKEHFIKLNNGTCCGQKSKNMHGQLVVLGCTEREIKITTFS